ncbi:MAG: hypothetical protein AAF242_17960 [Bacteroidota bacterium]
MTWFEKLFGFKEESPDQVRANLEWQGTSIYSKATGGSFEVGTLEIPSLEELRGRYIEKTKPSKIQLREVLGDVKDYHRNPENAGALFQAASQFNLLEMVHQGITPEMGIGRYEYDLTQGPACAIACGAGTLFRNYLIPVDGQIGQTKDQQIDCLAQIGQALDNPSRQLWSMQNGYALLSEEGLSIINQELERLDAIELEFLKGKLQVGLQKDTEVTISASKHLVSQVYCSALPVAYSQIYPNLWEQFARLILEATYEATLLLAYENYLKTHNPKVFLTLVGGGAFGNYFEWIIDAIVKAILKYQHLPLELIFVSYSAPAWEVREVCRRVEELEGSGLGA